MFALIWRYEVKEEARAAFEATYGPTGAWAQLFARAEGFRGTELFRADDGSYLSSTSGGPARISTPSWPPMARIMRRSTASTESWTRSEHRIGDYEVLG